MPEDFHTWAQAWFARLKAVPESPAYLDAVAAWRNYWRPERVRIVLLAESHVAEHPGDSSVSVEPPSYLSEAIPGKYVRLVYCLGYGESDLCRPSPSDNAGTPQFWNIFGQVALGESPPLKRNSTLRDRLTWKLSVLDTLRNRGIWLQDASPLGMYLGAGRRLPESERTRLLQQGYNRYVWPTVAEDEPEQVWVIGRGVANALSGFPGIDGRRVITQPQDRNRSQHLDGLQALCRAVA